MKPVDFTPPFGYVFRIEYAAVRSKVRNNRIYISCFRKFPLTELYVGRLELNPTTKDWQLGISLGCEFHPSKQAIINLVKWANQHISRKRSVLLAKLIEENKNDNQTTVAQD